MNLMPYGVEHETPKTVFCCVVNIATLDVVRRSLRLLHPSKSDCLYFEQPYSLWCLHLLTK
jgi:hypothetical protein